MSLKISVVICTYNRAKFINDALQSLARQTFGKENFQVIIINNNSTDQTEAICLDFITKHPEIQTKYVIENQQGLSYARNRGIEESDYEVISYIDDDAIASPYFLEKINQYLTEHPIVMGLGGKVIPKYEIEEPSWMSKYLEGLVTKVDMGEKVKQYNRKSFPAGCNMIYRKKILIESGGFNNSLKWRADDKYIYYAVRQLSDQIFYVPDIVVQHQIDAHRTSYKSFIQLCKKTGKEEGLRVLGESKFAYLLKIAEYFIKFFGSIILAIPYYGRGQFPKGNYLILYRYYALLGLFLAWNNAL